MTETNKRQLKNRIIESRARIIKDYPFFAILLMYLKFVVVNDIKKISTDGTSIYFSQEYIKRLRDRELDYALCHQVMHILSGDIFCDESFKNDTYHFACDISITNEMLKVGFGTSGFTHLGHLYSYIPGASEIDIDNLSRQEIYCTLPYSLEILDERSRKRYLLDDNKYWNRNEPIYNKDYEVILDCQYDIVSQKPIVDIDGDGVNQGKQEDGTKTNKKGLLTSSVSTEQDDQDCALKDVEDLKEQWESVIKTTAQNLIRTNKEQQKGVSNIPGFVFSSVRDMGNRKINWRKLLNNFLQENICDYSFTPPDKRYTESEFFLPDFNEKNFQVKNILFMVDTSGSINKQQLHSVYGEIYGAIEQFNGAIEGKIGFFDTEVKEPIIDFCSKSELKKILPVGGGGTLYSCIFDYLTAHKNIEPSCLIIFTDGYANFSEYDFGLPLLWVINNEEITPPYGKVIRLID